MDQRNKGPESVEDEEGRDAPAGHDGPTSREAPNLLPPLPTKHEDAPVSLSITRRVRPGREREFEEFLQGILDVAATFPGHQGAQIFRPARGDRTYRVVFRFDQKRNLRRWKESEERRMWLARGDELAEEPPQFANITGTAQDRSLALALTPLESFVRTSVSGIGLLLLGTVVAIVLANSPLSDTYARFWETEFTVGTASFGITESLRAWVNDGLMALFFFIVGLEIKREVLVGELRSPRQAALPIAAAIGGAIVPAVIYAGINLSGDGLRGWGIPMATDTAFSLGIVSLLGTRVRPLLLVFLTAFAIVDDILAVAIIAVFYTEQIVWPAVAVAVALLGLLVFANIAGRHRWPIYAFLGLGVWIAIFESGIHGTLAGVLLAMVVPARSWINPSEFLVRGRQYMDDFEAACFIAPSVLSNEPQQQATRAMEALCEEVETPLTHFQHKLNSWVAFGVLPIFALANAGIPMLSGFGDALASPVTWGVIAGLVIGKPIGITLFVWVAVRLGFAYRPPAIAWSHIVGVALLGGVGFTMSLFITELAFEHGDLGDIARIGILLGSIIAGIAGYLALNATLPPPREDVAN